MPIVAGLHYELHGPADGPPLILSAGLGGSGGYWAPNLPALAERHRVILYDHRGTGQSDRSPLGAYPVAAWARDILLLMDTLEIERASIVGHAAGALVGLALANWLPSRVDRLVLVNGWAKADPATLRCFDARLHILSAGGPRAYLEAQPIFLFPAPWISANGARLAAETETHLAHFQGEDTLRNRITAISAFDATSWIDAHATPTLAIAARDDVLVPYTASEALAAANPRISLALMDWGGHACNVTYPERFNRLVLDFLGE